MLARAGYASASRVSSQASKDEMMIVRRGRVTCTEKALNSMDCVYHKFGGSFTVCYKVSGDIWCRCVSTNAVDIFVGLGTRLSSHIQTLCMCAGE